MATDANSSILSVAGTPLKAIENVCSSIIAGSLNDSGNDPSISGISQPTFIYPQQTSTPAARRIAPKRVVPLMEVVVGSAVSLHQSTPAVLSTVAADSACFSQDGGFLHESQTVVPVQPDVIDLTLNEVNTAVSSSQFKPMAFSTQISDGPVAAATAGSNVSKVLHRISNFENSFADDVDVVPENKFKPAAIGTQISVTRSAGDQNHLCPANSNLMNSFASETLVNGVTESGSGNVMEAGTVAKSAAAADEMSIAVPQRCDSSTAFELSQHVASRSPSPELFDGDVAMSDKPPSAVSSPANNPSGCYHKALASDDNKTTNSNPQSSVSHSTIAQKLASRKLYARDSVNDQGAVAGNHDPPNSEKTLVAHRASGSMKEIGCEQIRRSTRLSKRSKMSLHDSKCRSRGVDFVDEIDEVFLHTFLFFYSLKINVLYL